MKNVWLDRKIKYVQLKSSYGISIEMKDVPMIWDFNTVLGDQIKGKYESLYGNVREVSFEERWQKPSNPAPGSS
jgi:hypothetical protein